VILGLLGHVTCTSGTLDGQLPEKVAWQVRESDSWGGRLTLPIENVADWQFEVGSSVQSLDAGISKRGPGIVALDDGPTAM
jgi:hypothetical protein